MNFLFPTFLIGLVAIAIPIIIHLFNFRRYKKVYFTNVQFLKELKQESDSKSKLKEWLILACRILAITCLVFAFAQPFIAGKSKNIQGQKAISIYVDNSFSMENTNKKGTLLENAKQLAEQITKGFNASDKFQLITNDFEGKHQRFLSKEEFVEELDAVKISASTRNINDVIKRQQDFLQNSNSKNKRVFVLSDFQKNNALINKTIIDTSVIINYIPITSTEVNNLYIDSVWFTNPVQQHQTQQTVHATILNKSNKEIENGSLKLFINNKQIALSAFSIGSNDKKEVTLSFVVKEKCINYCVLKLEDYPITYDDDFYFTFNSQIIVNALVINGKDSKTAGNFKSLLQKDSLFNFVENNETAIDYGQFANTNIIILNELTAITSGLTSELQKFVSAGGSVVIFPNTNTDLVSYNTAFTNLQVPQLLAKDTSNTTTQAINAAKGLYEGVFEKLDVRMDMPKAFEYYTLKQSTNSSAQTIIALQNNAPFLSEIKNGNGKIYLFTTPSNASSTNFTKHALFVPTIIKMAILSLKPTPIYYKTATNEAIQITSTKNFSDKPLHIVKADKTMDVIPEHRNTNNSTTLFTQNQITQAGYYNITDNLYTLASTAFNFDRKESDLTFLSNDDLQKQIDEMGLKNISIINADEKTINNSLQEINEGKKLWKLFLILALVFLLTEIIIIRIFK